MAAARFSSEVLRMFYGRIKPEENRNLLQALEPVHVLTHDTFLISKNDFEEWLRVWRMNVTKESKDLLKFAK